MRKVLLGLSAVALAVASVPLFAAFEAHVINVTARIENALKVDTTPIEFGTVFPEERLVKGPIEVTMSGSFIEEPDADDINYVIKQKPKCRREDGTYVPVEQVPGTTQHRCPVGSVQLPLLCPYLSKTEVTRDGEGATGPRENDGPAIQPLHDPNATSSIAFGRLAKSEGDRADAWAIDILVPCFKGKCAQDNVIPPEWQLDPTLEHATFGCDLWLEVTGISRVAGPDSGTGGQQP